MPYRFNVIIKEGAINEIENDIDSEEKNLPTSSANPECHTEKWTLKDLTDNLGLGPFQREIVILLGLLWFSISIPQVTVPIVLPRISEELHIPASRMGVLGSAIGVAMLISSLACGWLADKIGRRPVILVASFVLAAAPILMALSTNFWLFGSFALIMGLSIGGIIPIAFTMSIEYLPTNSRGAFVMLFSILWLIGMAVALIPILFLDWRLALGLTGVPVVVVVVFLTLKLEEGIVFLLAKGDHVRAENVLKKLLQVTDGSSSAHFKFDLDWNQPYYRDGLGSESGLTAGGSEMECRWSDLFRHGRWRTTMILWALWFTESMGHGFVFWLTTIWKGYGFSDNAIYLMMVPFALFPVLVYLFLFFTVDKIGRLLPLRLSLPFSVGLLVLWMILDSASIVVQGIILSLWHATAETSHTILYLYTAELYPTKLRGKALGSCLALARLSTIVHLIWSGYTLESSVRLTIFIYAGCSLIAFVLSLFLFKETVQCDLSEGDFYAEGRKSRTD